MFSQKETLSGALTTHTRRCFQLCVKNSAQLRRYSILVSRVLLVSLWERSRVVLAIYQSRTLCISPESQFAYLFEYFVYLQTVALALCFCTRLVGSDILFRFYYEFEIAFTANKFSKLLYSLIDFAFTSAWPDVVWDYDRNIFSHYLAWFYCSNKPFS